MNQNGINLAKTPTSLRAVLNSSSVSGMYQGANSSTAGFLPNGNQALVEQRQGLGEAGGVRMNKAALERVARLALAELPYQSDHSIRSLVSLIFHKIYYRRTTKFAAIYGTNSPMKDGDTIQYPLFFLHGSVHKILYSTPSLLLHD